MKQYPQQAALVREIARNRKSLYLYEFFPLRPYADEN
jgi:hypothetical protein